jgi:AcrR family transcriptional regulator
VIDDGAPRSIWLRAERAGRGPAPEHDRAQIAAAGVELADAGGLDAVSMRKVAATIGSGTASLYRYVRNRDEILELMMDAVSGEIDLSRPVSGDWRGDLLALAHEVGAVYRRHPWMLDFVQTGAGLGPNAVSYLEYALAALQGVPAPGGAKLEAVAMLNGVVAMFVRMEIATHGSTEAWQSAQAEYLTAVVSAGRHPRLAAAVADPAPSATSDSLDRVLPRVLTGLLGVEQR